jgi:hypothetical protein
MLLTDFVKIPPLASLGVVVGILGIAVIASVWEARKNKKPVRIAGRELEAV